MKRPKYKPDSKTIEEETSQAVTPAGHSGLVAINLLIFPNDIFSFQQFFYKFNILRSLLGCQMRHSLLVTGDETEGKSGNAFRIFQ